MKILKFPSEQITLWGPIPTSKCDGFLGKPITKPRGWEEPIMRKNWNPCSQCDWFSHVLEMATGFWENQSQIGSEFHLGNVIPFWSMDLSVEKFEWESLTGFSGNPWNSGLEIFPWTNPRAKTWRVLVLRQCRGSHPKTSGYVSGQCLLEMPLRGVAGDRSKGSRCHVTSAAALRWSAPFSAGKGW